MCMHALSNYFMILMMTSLIIFDASTNDFALSTWLTVITFNKKYYLINNLNFYGG